LGILAILALAGLTGCNRRDPNLPVQYPVTGQITLDDKPLAGAGIMFLPRRPYMPLGTLRTVLTYPDAAAQFSDAVVRAALDRVGLGRMAPKLDRVQRWDKELRLDEQQHLAFARLLADDVVGPELLPSVIEFAFGAQIGEGLGDCFRIHVSLHARE